MTYVLVEEVVLRYCKRRWRDGYYVAVPGASVEIVDADSSRLATLYDPHGQGTLANPTPTDRDGRISFYIEPGEYRLNISGAGFESTTRILRVVVEAFYKLYPTIKK